MSEQLVNTYNYLVPAAGTTRSYRVTQNFAAGDIKHCDFRNMALDGVSFVPTGVLVDNTRGTGDCVITIIEFAWRIVVPAGTTLNMPYPAPYNQTATIEGDGDITVVFVDYPVIPFISNSGGGVMSGVTRVLAGDNILVDNTDPSFPIISSTGGGGDGGGSSEIVVSIVSSALFDANGNATPAAPYFATYDPEGLIDENGAITIPDGITYVEFNISYLDYAGMPYEVSFYSTDYPIVEDVAVTSDGYVSSYVNYVGTLINRVGNSITPKISASGTPNYGDEVSGLVTFNIKMRK